MGDNSGWYARKFGGATPAPPRNTVPAPTQQNYQAPQQYGQQQQPPVDPNHKMSMDDMHNVLASGNPDANGGAKTRAMQARAVANSCPECGSNNMRAQVGNSTVQCFECGWTPRFGHRSVG